MTDSLRGYSFVGSLGPRTCHDNDLSDCPFAFDVLRSELDLGEHRPGIDIEKVQLVKYRDLFCGRN